MIVLIILGILGLISWKFFRGDPASQVARRIAALMSTANRLAVAGGPVRANVIAASGVTARTEIEFNNTTRMITVYRLVEHTTDNGYDWVSVSGLGLPAFVNIQAVASTAELQLLADSGHAMPTALGTGTATKLYYPNGTVDAMTVYVTDTRLGATGKWRIVSLPLQAAPQTYLNW